MSYLIWILMGLVAGAIAKLLMPGDQKGGCISTSLLGMAGAFVGGWIGQLIGFLPDDDPTDKVPGAGGLITATVGALILLIIFAKFSKGKGDADKK